MLVKRLLTPDLAKRYGNLRNGVADIKEHKWFAGFDWNALMKKQLPPPHKPVFKVSLLDNISLKIPQLASQLQSCQHVVVAWSTSGTA